MDTFGWRMPPVLRPYSYLTLRFSGLVPAAVRERGELYVVDRQVVLEEVTKRLVKARVEGDTPCRVTAAVAEDRLCVSCTCLRFEPEPRCCEHIWGALVEAELHGGLFAAVAAEESLPLVAERDPPFPALAAVEGYDPGRSAVAFLPLALELCPRSVIMNGGRVVADRPTVDLLEDPDLLAANRLELPYGFGRVQDPNER